MAVNTWFTSDQHFDHDKVIGFCNRPFTTVAEMNEAMIRAYRARVKENETVYFIGDVFFGNYAESKIHMDQLPGHKILIQGNHDKFSQQQYLSLGFEMVLEEAVIRLFGRRLHLCHYPRMPTLWDRIRSRVVHKYDYRYMDRRRPYDGRWLLHGHTHSKEQVNARRRTIHVGVDAWNYAPIRQRELESIIAIEEI